VFDINREVSIEKNVDATGKRWVIHANRSNGLCYIRPDPDRENAQIPKQMQGLFTKASLAKAEIDKYLKLSWDQAEQAQLKNKQKAERIAAKKEAASDDDGTESN